MNWSASAKILADARLNDIRLDEPPRPDPQNTEEAYALQEAVTQELGFEVIGWKVGATNPVAQAALGANEPFAGPIFKERSFAKSAELKTAADALRIPEAEFALLLKQLLYFDRYIQLLAPDLSPFEDRRIQLIH